MTREEREVAIAYIKCYRKLDEDLHNIAPKDSVSYHATNKCLKYWDMAIEALQQQEEYVAKMDEVRRAYDNISKAEPCTDAVSRQAVKEQMIKYGFLAPDMTVTEFVEDLPLVSPWKPKIGHWITLKDAYGDVIEAVCSNCDKNGNHEWSICPYCSAIMVKQQESEDV